MTFITIPNRPTGQSPPHIADLLANFDAITTAINGSLIVRRELLLQAQAQFLNSSGAGPFILGQGDALGSGVAAVSSMPALWAGDSGLSSQPTDFALSGTTAKARIRASATINNVGNTGSVTIGTIGFAAVTSGGTSGHVNFTANTGAPVTSFTPTWLPGPVTALTDGMTAYTESAEFSLPTAAGAYALYVSGLSVAANYLVDITLQLFAYNS